MLQAAVGCNAAHERPVLRCAFLMGLVTLLIAAPVPGAAQIITVERGEVTLSLGGYVRSFTAFHDLGYDPPRLLPGQSVPERQSGVHSQVVRMKWLAEGNSWRLEVHDRLQARVTSTPGSGGAVGFGVSQVPDRLVDLEAEIVGRDRLRVWHDVDRLALSLYTDAVDLTIGRQAITWGTAAIFPVADLWARFSPFEQETDEKPGVDAVRALFYPLDGLEMDAVVAHRGSAEDLSAGIRGAYSLDRLDLWAGGGKFWREAIAMAGATLLLDQARIRLEAALPWNLDDGELQDPRATLGADWLSGTLSITGEYHFNGIGRPDPTGYDEVAVDRRFLRGETYYLGRHYLGGLVSWSPDVENRLTLALNGLANLEDGSTAFSPLASYDLGQATRLSVGGLVSTGDSPQLQLLPPALNLRSEFGAYGDMVFTMVSVYF